MVKSPHHLTMKKYLSKIPSLPTLLLYGVFFIAGAFFAKVAIPPTIIKATVLREAGYKYINPILLCNTNNGQEYNEDNVLSKQLLNYQSSNQTNDLSVYFLSLVGGGWSSLNENETYSPASMLKVPTVVEALKSAESDPSILSKKIYYDGSFDDNKAEYFKSQQSIQAGQSYSVDELMPYIIDYSDNNALRLLHNALTQSSFDKLYKDLGIEIPANSIDFMSAKTYSLFLRVLYNSTYLTRDDSEKVMKLLLFHDFPQGLEAGVPSSVEVGQKFGERQVINPDGTIVSRELHDCGIIYIPNKPYILCVMTKGQDFTSLSNDIKNVSRLVYNHEMGVK